MKQTKKYKEFVENRMRLYFNSEQEFVLELLDTIIDLYKYDDSNTQKKFYRNVLKYLLFNKFGDSPLKVNNIKEVYPSVYPICELKSNLGFSQFEVVLDKSNKKHEIGIVLMIYSDDLSEIRLDTNGNMSETKVAKLTLDNFIKRLDFTIDYNVRLLKGILL